MAGDVTQEQIDLQEAYVEALEKSSQARRQAADEAARAAAVSEARIANWC